jgi:urease accessory protein
MARSLRSDRLPVRLAAATAGSLGAAALAAAPASAHPGHDGGLGQGLLHPFTGVDHLLAMVAVGVVAAIGTRHRSRWAVPGAFLAGMVVGGVAGMVGLPLPGVEVAIAASVVALGVVVAGAVTTSGRGLLAGLVVAGMAHGWAHGAEAPKSGHAALYVTGFLLATVALHLAGMGVGTAVRDRRLVRIGIGAATAAAGALLLAA